MTEISDLCYLRKPRVSQRTIKLNVIIVKSSLNITLTLKGLTVLSLIVRIELLMVTQTFL